MLSSPDTKTVGRRKQLRAPRPRSSLSSSYTKKLSISDFEKLAETTGKLESRRFTYNATTSELSFDHHMAGGIHEKKKWWTHYVITKVLLAAAFIVYVYGKQDQDVECDRIFDIEDNTGKLSLTSEWLIKNYAADFHYFVGRYRGSQRTPDLSVVNKSVKRFQLQKNYMPVFVMEGAVGQSYTEVMVKTKLWLFGSPLTRCVLVLKTWTPDKWGTKTDLEGMEDENCVLEEDNDSGPDDEFSPDPHDTDESGSSTDSQSVLSSSHTSPVDGNSQSSKTREKQSVVEFDTNYCLEACHGAREIYQQYKSQTPSETDILETPYVTLRAEIWRRVPIHDPPQAGKFRIAREQVRYVTVRGNRVDDEHSTLEFWRSDFYDAETPEERVAHPDMSARYEVNFESLFTENKFLKASVVDRVVRGSNKKRKRAQVADIYNPFFIDSMAAKRGRLN